ncbi:hypothetical protein BST83_01070 [Polaribacter filamentus]|uniref:CBU-0592-like domain-containing protein n=1 Tax=Polaribacter filamentus TaxID=53483 RepID=A0A2S7L2M9_9FLAO|nr:hypothetical protein [Polaribacter filamentus]PQB08973.1 hypothetical protein BST83_01070 [Polaribacter filamentus]
MFYSIVGWLGVVIFIVAYFLLSLEVLCAKKTTYHWLNAFGAICLVCNALGINDYPSLTVNAAWGIIALFTTIKLKINQSKSAKSSKPKA